MGMVNVQSPPVIAGGDVAQVPVPEGVGASPDSFARQPSRSIEKIPEIPARERGKAFLTLP